MKDDKVWMLIPLAAFVVSALGIYFSPCKLPYAIATIGWLGVLVSEHASMQDKQLLQKQEELIYKIANNNRRNRYGKDSRSEDQETDPRHSG